MIISVRWIAITIATLTVTPSMRAHGDDAPPDFANNVRSVLQKNCIACHNKQKAEGGLNLESLDALKKGGDSGKVFQEKSSAQSSMIKRVKGEEELMPPDGNNVGAKRLTPEEIAMLSAWIDSGAIAGTEKNTQPMQWQPLPQSIRPIYAMAASSDGQFTVVGRGNQSVVYRWIADGDKGAVVLADPAASQVTKTNASIPMSIVSATHLDLVQSVAISPDATRIATGGYREVKIWRRQSGPFQDRLVANLRGSVAIQHSPDGANIAKVTAAPSLELISSETGKVFQRMEYDVDISSVGWGTDGKQLLVSLVNGEVELLEQQPAGNWVKSHSQKMDSAFADVLLSKERTLIARTLEKKIQVWKWSSSGESSGPWTRTPFFEDLSNIVSTSLIGGESVLLGLQSGSLYFGSLSDGKMERSMEHGAELVKVIATSDGKLGITVGKDGVTKGWNLSDGKMAWENRIDSSKAIELQTAEVLAARQKAKVDRGTANVPVLEKAQTTESENVAKLQKSRTQLVEALQKKTTEVEAQSKNVSDAEAAMTAAMQAIEEAKKKLEQTQKDLETKKQQLATAEKAKAEEATKIAAMDKNIAGAEQSVQKAAAQLAAFRSQLEEEKKTQSGLDARATEVKSTAMPIPATNATLSVDGQSIYTTHADGSVRALRSDNGIQEGHVAGGLDRSAGFVPTVHGKAISISDDGRAHGCEFGNRWTLERTIGDASESPFSDRVTAMDFSEDGQTLLVGSGPPSRFGDLKAVLIKDGSIVKDWGPVHSDTILVVKSSPDGKWIATGGADKLVRLHSVSAEVPLRTLEGHTHHVLGLAWHDDGVLLASSSADNSVKIWDVEAGQSQRTIAGFGKEVTALSFVGRSNQLLSSCADQQIRLHDATNGKSIRTMGGPADAVYSLAAVTPNPFSAPNAVAIAGGQDGIVWIWKIEDGKALHQIK